MKWRKLLTAGVIAAGPNNPMVRIWLRREARSHGAELRFANGAIEVRKGARRVRINNRHFPFVRDLAEKFDFFFEQVEPSDGLVDVSGPKLHRYISNGLEFEFTSMPEEQQAIESYLSAVRPEAGELVFNVGAYCGVTTHRLAQMVGPTGRVIAFEPDELNHAALLRNLKRHELQNVTGEGRNRAAIRQLRIQLGGLDGLGLELGLLASRFGKPRARGVFHLGGGVRTLGNAVLHQDGYRGRGTRRDRRLPGVPPPHAHQLRHRY